MKLFAVCAGVLSTILILLWPVAFFMSAFLFDAPRHGLANAVMTVAALGIFSYPLGYLVAMIVILSRKSAGWLIPWWASPTAYLFLLPFVHLGIAVGLASLVLG